MFTVPQKLSELDNGLKYRFMDEEFDDGLYSVEVYDKNGVVLESIAKNAHKKSKKAELYNIALTSNDSSVAGIVPLVSTEDDVLKQFGEPGERVLPEFDGDKKRFKYGLYEKSTGFASAGKSMTVSFDNKGIVQTITITYSEKQ